MRRIIKYFTNRLEINFQKNYGRCIYKLVKVQYLFDNYLHKSFNDQVKIKCRPTLLFLRYKLD